MDGVGQGGLGWKTAVDMALPAFLASRVASMPDVKASFDSVESSGLGSSQALLAAYDARTTEASSRLNASLPEDLAMSMQGILQDVAALAARRWRCMTKHEEDGQDVHVGGLDAFLGNALDADGDELGGATATHEVGRAFAAVVESWPGGASVTSFSGVQDGGLTSGGSRSCVTPGIRTARGCGRSETGFNCIWRRTSTLLTLRTMLGACPVR